MTSRPDEIEALIAEFQRSGMRELHVRSPGFELYLSNDADTPGMDGPRADYQPAAPRAAPASTPPPAPAPAAPPSLDLPPGAVVVSAPYLGTFYRAPKPGAPAYVEIGSQVGADTEVCLVEVMKLFTAVRAGSAGRIHAVLATDGQLVEADQPLFVIIGG